MPNKSNKLFVYGSLLSGFHHPAYNYISRYFTLIGEAKVRGVLYDLGSYPAAVPAENEAYISGELYRLNNESEFAWAMEQLDDYEGLNVEAGEIALYRRQIAQIYLHNEVTEAWIYWYNGSIEGCSAIASGDVLQFLHEKSKI